MSKHGRTSSVFEDARASPLGSSARARPPKRSVQACTSCRKHKTRCEILDVVNLDIEIQCHRCKVLNNRCSYADMDRSVFQAFTTSSASSPTAAGGSPGTPEYTPNPADGDHGPRTYDPRLFGRAAYNIPKPDRIWEFIGPTDEKLDWSLPMVAIQELAKQEYHINVPLPTIPDQFLDQILAAEDIQHLLNIFEARHTPWLNFPILRNSNHHFLNLVCCTIASRHLESDMRLSTAPRLQKLTEDTVVKIIFNPRAFETLESIQALLILALWAPISGGESGVRDGRLLIAAAVSIALSLRLGEASGKVISLRNKIKNHALYEQDPEYQQALTRARLWLSLTIIESMLCMGSGRKALSQRTVADILFIEFTCVIPENFDGCRDLRLRLQGEMFNALEESTGIALNDLSEKDSWFDKMFLVLQSMDRLYRLMRPLPVVCKYDKFFFDMQMLVLQCSRFLILYQANSDIRHAFTGEQRYWFMDFKPHGIAISPVWAKENLVTAEGVLISFLQAERSLISTMPDIFFNMIALAASFIVATKFLLLKTLGMDLPGASDAIIQQSLDVLTEIALAPDHAAKRAASLVDMLFNKWKNRNNPLYPPTPQSTSGNSTDSDLGSPTPGQSMQYGSSFNIGSVSGSLSTMSMNAGDHSLGSSWPVENIPYTDEATNDFWARFFTQDIEMNGVHLNAGF